MAFPRRKSRVVTFRLPDEEFEQFQALYSAGNERSMSDLMRRAVEQLLEKGTSPGQNQALVEHVSQIDQRVMQLESRIEDLRQLCASRDAAAPE